MEISPQHSVKWCSYVCYVFNVGLLLQQGPVQSRIHFETKAGWINTDCLWPNFKCGSAPAFYKLEKMLTNKMAVTKLSPSTRLHLRLSTASSFVLHQRMLFPFLGKLCRLCLADMYYKC